MNNRYISTPMDFQEMTPVDEGSLNMDKTFDLAGMNNDDRLRLYLRKAGLSDEIECLSPEQRRAFIIDIIKSNKPPGYWMPSTVKGSVFGANRPPVRPPPPPTFTSAPINNPNSSVYASPGPVRKSGMPTSLSENSLTSLNSTVVPNRFANPQPQTPPSPTTFETTRKLKGKIITISGPTGFKHVQGDLSRDRTNLAFDLHSNNNDNMLKKYFIEKGISESDVVGMKREDIIRQIIQSKFTWIPPKKQNSIDEEIQSRIVYATINTNNQITPPHTPTGQITNFGRFANLTNRFADPSEFPTPAELQQSNTNSSSILEIDSRTWSQTPPPAILRKPNSTTPPASGMYLPRPYEVTASQTMQNVYQSKGNDSVYESPLQNNGDRTIPKKSTKSTPPPPPPTKMTIPPPQPPASVKLQIFPPPPPMPTGGSIPPPPPPMPTVGTIPPPPPPMPKSGPNPPPPPAMPVGGLIPRPPPPPMSHESLSTPRPPVLASSNTNNEEDSHDALLADIRKGITLKKVNQNPKSATISVTRPRQERPPVMDFMSELNKAMTTRRIKNPQLNPYSESTKPNAKKENDESYV